MITLDTNLLVYAFDQRYPRKQAVATLVFNQMSLANSYIGLQVVGELQNVLRRKLGRSPREAAQAARGVKTAFKNTFGPTSKAVDDALAELEAGRLSYWDALLLGAARDAGCDTMLSEDMQDGARLLSMHVVNPFDTNGGLSEGARRLLAM